VASLRGVAAVTCALQCSIHLGIAAPRKRVESQVGGSRFGNHISAWRRAVCGDLSSAFQPASAAASPRCLLRGVTPCWNRFHKAQFKALPSGYRKLSAADIEQFREQFHRERSSASLPSIARPSAAWTPRQEKGVRPSLPLPYELYARDASAAGRKFLEIAMESQRSLRARSADPPFHVTRRESFNQQVHLRTRAYAVGPASA